MERDLYAGLIEGANREGWALWRLPDAPYLPPRPADISGCAPDGRAVLLEVKIDSRAWPMGGLAALHFEDAQIRWLRAFAARGGLALVAAYWSAGKSQPSRMRLIQVAGQGDDLGTGQTGGLVGARSAELKRAGGQTGAHWTGWAAALKAWNEGGPAECGR